MLAITRCVKFVPKYLHKNPTTVDTLQNDTIKILMLLTSALNQLKTFPVVPFPANSVVPERVDAIPTRIPEKDNEDVVQPNQQSMSQDDKTFHSHKKQSRLKKMLLYDCH